MQRSMDLWIVHANDQQTNILNENKIHVAMEMQFWFVVRKVNVVQHSANMLAEVANSASNALLLTCQTLCSQLKHHKLQAREFKRR